MKIRWEVSILLVALLGNTVLTAQQRRKLQVEDLLQLRSVRDPHISPDGKWVAFTVARLLEAKDTGDNDIYVVSIDGQESQRWTNSEKSESSPRWSPDGRYLAFLSAREGKKAQVYLIDRRGGEARRLTEIKTGVSDLVWSPDGRRLALILRDPEPDAEETTEADKEDKEKAPKPIVVTRLQFKRDGRGYLTNAGRHLHILEVETAEIFQLTRGPYDDGSPVWSPDGQWLAFVSNRTEEPDANNNSDLFLIEARPDSRPVQLTRWEGSDNSPSFRPDGGALVYLRGGEPADIWYATNNLALVEVEQGRAVGEPRIVTPGLDRNLRSPRYTPDGKSVVFLLEERLNRHLASVSLEDGIVRRVVGGNRDISGFDQSPQGELVVLESQLDYPPEISRVQGGALSRLSRQNDAFLKGIELAQVEKIEAVSRDGTVIDAFLTRAPGAGPGPGATILRIHGGPVGQYSHRFILEWQLLAAHGYHVVAANPRGSSGRGRDFSYAIWADWGNKDFQDVMAAVDRVIDMGVADPERLGVGGWSYGGILTNYVITQTTRFKAAISGASEVNYTANYGHDHYQRQWEKELGLPWENVDLWVRLSPFFKVKEIKTPTLVMCGQVDWNVPLQNSEQLYQALRRLGVETQLVIYPGQGHGIRRPSYQIDRYRRYLQWYDRFLRDQPEKPLTESGKFQP